MQSVKSWQALAANTSVTLLGPAGTCERSLGMFSNSMAMPWGLRQINFARAGGAPCMQLVQRSQSGRSQGGSLLKHKAASLSMPELA